MLGYSESKIAAKAAKRGITVEKYTEYLLEKRRTRGERRRKARESA